MSNTNAYIVGVSVTPFRRLPERDHKSLTAEVVTGVLADAGLDGQAVGAVWFGSCALHAWGQPNLGASVCLTPLVSEGVLAEHVPMTCVEGGCATGALSLLGALKDVRAGDADLALAVGVEKTFLAHAPAQIPTLFEAALDQLDTEHWQAYYARAAAEHGLEFAPRPGRLTLLDVYALEAAWHMKTHGTTAAQMAASAAKNHAHAAHNPNAFYTTPDTVDAVLADKPIIGPLTRSMCSPISDGAAAVLVASEAGLARLTAAARERAVRVTGYGQASGRYRRLDQPSLARVAARRAYQQAGLTPADIEVAEVHDATSFSELYACEMLGFCNDGQGGPFVASGATTLGGQLPINPSGGLVSRGHPLAASGLAMVHEITTQLRGEAGARQVDQARTGLVHNGGGLTGLDEAAAVVMCLAAPGE